MRALLRKDFVWYALLLVGATGIFGAAILSNRADRLWIHGIELRFDVVFAVWIIAGVVVGFVACFADRALGTREYLLHRPQSWSRVFWVRTAMCLGILLLANVLPYVYSWISPTEDTGNRTVWDASRAWLHLSMASCIVPAFALGAFAALSHGSFVAILFKLGVLGMPTIFLMQRLLRPLDSGYLASPWLYAAVQLMVGLFILHLSARGFIRGFDRDVDDALSERMPLLGGVALTASLLAGLFAGGAQQSWQRNVRRAYPEIIAQPDGVPHLAKVRHMMLERENEGELRNSWPNWITVRFAEFRNEQHRRRAKPTIMLDDNDRLFRTNTEGWRPYSDQYWHMQLWPRNHVRNDWSPMFEESADTLLNQMQRSWTIHSTMHRIVRILRPSGRLRVMALRNRGVPSLRRNDLETLPKPWTRDFQRADKKPFGHRVSIVTVSDGSFLFDGSDLTLWRLTADVTRGPHEASLESIPLPKPFRPTALSHAPGNPHLANNRVGIQRDIRDNVAYLLLVQDGDCYHWKNDQLVPVEPTPKLRELLEQQRRIEAALPIQRRLVSRVTAAGIRDSLKHRAEILDEKGRTIFSHDYEPRTKFEHALVLVGCAYSALRAPLFELGSYALDSNQAWLFDPFVMGNKRIAPLLFCLVAMVILLLIAIWRMKRLHMQRSTRLLWLVLIALFGVGAFVAFFFLERARAHRPVPLRNSGQRPALLLASPARADHRAVAT